jgi:hypothetical protein
VNVLKMDEKRLRRDAQPMPLAKTVIAMRSYVGSRRNKFIIHVYNISRMEVYKPTFIAKHAATLKGTFMKTQSKTPPDGLLFIYTISR